jgi:hypothetical protein
MGFLLRIIIVIIRLFLDLLIDFPPILIDAVHLLVFFDRILIDDLEFYSRFKYFGWEYYILFFVCKFFQQEAVSFIPITENKSSLDSNASLDHGFDDLPFFPTWGEFLQRSQDHIAQYPNYMTYLFCKSSNLEIIGLIAVQYSMFDKLKSKVQPRVGDLVC